MLRGTRPWQQCSSTPRPRPTQLTAGVLPPLGGSFVEMLRFADHASFCVRYIAEASIDQKLSCMRTPHACRADYDDRVRLGKSILNAGQKLGAAFDSTSTMSHHGDVDRVFSMVLLKLLFRTHVDKRGSIAYCLNRSGAAQLPKCSIHPTTIPYECVAREICGSKSVRKHFLTPRSATFNKDLIVARFLREVAYGAFATTRNAPLQS